MRTLGGLFGAGVVPLAYLTIRNAGHSKTAASLSALAILFGKTNNQCFI
jgi:dolichyl-phosphate-mannose-protein mannosyltransferase